MGLFEAGLDATDSTSAPVRLVFGPCVSSGESPYPHSQHHAWKQRRPAIARMYRAESQWVRGSGVPPVLVVEGFSELCARASTHFLPLLRPECLRGWRGLPFGVGGFPRTHAFEIY